MAHTILVVDDEESVRRAWQKALRHGGYHALTAGTEATALSLCDEHQFDAVVLDFIMPGITGVELLVKIRRRLPFVRSIIVSGKLDAELSAADVSKELRAEVEADQYLHKPVSNDALRAAVESLLKEGQPTTWKAIAEKSTNIKRMTLRKAAGTAKRLKAYKRKK